MMCMVLLKMELPLQVNWSLH